MDSPSSRIGIKFFSAIMIVSGLWYAGLGIYTISSIGWGKDLSVLGILLLSIPYLVIGLGLWYLKKWALYLTATFLIINLVYNMIMLQWLSSLIAVFAIFYLTSEDMAAVFG